jgi:hypothetical protein
MYNNHIINKCKKNPQNEDLVGNQKWQSQTVSCSELLELLEEMEKVKNK